MRIDIGYGDPVYCQVINVEGNHKYMLVWAFNWEGQYVIYEFLTAWPLAVDNTLHGAQQKAAQYLKDFHNDIDLMLENGDKLNAPSDYGFSRN
ncbi:MAG: hypothetical protein JNM22_02015 [Saprospiraceae bacterium]|nr:hypothetical protein [Saprospiraceae bacterium]